MHLLVSHPQLWVAIFGFVSPLLGYALNSSLFKRVTEPTKAAVQILVAAAIGALYTAIDTSVFGWNLATLELVLTAVLAALLAHNWLYRPGAVNAHIHRIVGGQPPSQPN